MIWGELSQFIAQLLANDLQLSGYGVFVDAPPNNVSTPFILLTAVNERENHRYGNIEVSEINFDVAVFTPIDSTTTWSGHQSAIKRVKLLVRRLEPTLISWDISTINFIQHNPVRVTKDVLQSSMEFQTVAQEKES
jgi:hypothetical protein